LGFALLNHNLQNAHDMDIELSKVGCWYLRTVYAQNGFGIFEALGLLGKSGTQGTSNIIGLKTGLKKSK